MPPTLPLKLHDCRVHGATSGAELFVVEGDSASKSVCRVRDIEFQAVLPMQGKPMNAMKASRSAVQRYDLFHELIRSIGAGSEEQLDPSRSRFERIILLFDPDADGIHCGALMSMFFYRCMRPLLDHGRLFMIQPPLFEIVSPKTGETLHVYTEPQYQKLCAELERLKIAYESRRYRGLASMNEGALISTCVDPSSRNLRPLTTEDAETAIRVFMGSLPD
ncbi:MAG: toprim domain-containing protein [Rubripirellula sp.]